MAVLLNQPCTVEGAEVIGGSCWSKKKLAIMERERKVGRIDGKSEGIER